MRDTQPPGRQDEAEIPLTGPTGHHPPHGAEVSSGARAHSLGGCPLHALQALLPESPSLLESLSNQRTCDLEVSTVSKSCL